MAGSGRVAKGADGLGGLVLVGGQEVVEAFMAEGVHEPFAVVCESEISCELSIYFEDENLHVRTGKTLQSVEAEAGVFDENGTLDL